MEVHFNYSQVSSHTLAAAFGRAPHHGGPLRSAPIHWTSGSCMFYERISPRRAGWRWWRGSEPELGRGTVRASLPGWNDRALARSSVSARSGSRDARLAGGRAGSFTAAACERECERWRWPRAALLMACALLRAIHIQEFPGGPAGFRRKSMCSTSASCDRVGLGGIDGWRAAWRARLKFSTSILRKMSECCLRMRTGFSQSSTEKRD